MKNCVAIISIIVEKDESVNAVNGLLHEYGQYIIGRLGIPYRQRDINLICIAIDAPEAQLDALTAALDALEGIAAKAVRSHV